VAVPLPEDARASVGRLVASLRAGESSPPVVRWVRIDGLHLTLRFLGWTDPERAASVATIVAGVARRETPFDVTLTGGGAFPTLTRPRVLWLDVTDGGDRLAAIATALSGPLADLGWPPEERPFRAHLTLARTDGSPGAQAIARALALAGTDVRVDFRVAQIVVMESHPGGGPARYERFATAPLAG
jgi:2'-5' RNA ligase